MNTVFTAIFVMKAEPIVDKQTLYVPLNKARRILLRPGKRWHKSINKMSNAAINRAMIPDATTMAMTRQKTPGRCQATADSEQLR